MNGTNPTRREWVRHRSGTDGVELLEASFDQHVYELVGMQRKPICLLELPRQLKPAHRGDRRQVGKPEMLGGVLTQIVVHAPQREMIYPPDRNGQIVPDVEARKHAAQQVHLRLAEAKRRLGAGVPIAAVAADLGFADQSHLHRRFKGAFGMTPGEWRRMHHDPRILASRTVR